MSDRKPRPRKLKRDDTDLVPRVKWLEQVTDYIQGILKEDKYGAGRIYVAHQMWARCASELNGKFNNGVVALGNPSSIDRHLYHHAKTKVCQDKSMWFTPKPYIRWKTAMTEHEPKAQATHVQEFRFAHDQEEDLLASKAIDTEEERIYF